MYASGFLPVSDVVYRLLAGTKLVAVAKTNGKPRPVGVKGVFDRIGMCCLLRKYKEGLAAHFGSQGEFGTGIGGVSQLLSWSYKLAQEKKPESVQLWADACNGFNEMRRAAIDEGLSDMPPDLQWLRVSFNKFYSGDVLLYFQRDGETNFITGEEGTVQGDPASGVYFNAGAQRAFNVLRSEYPEAVLSKYMDDVMGHIDPANLKSCALSEPRAQHLPGFHNVADGVTVIEAPIAKVIIGRWQFLAKTMCGLRVDKKWGVSSVATALDQAEYGDVEVGGIPVLPGINITGVPVGADEFVKAAALQIVDENVGASFRAISSLTKTQHQHLLAVHCGGAKRVQHLWQTINPNLCHDSIARADDLTDAAVSRIAGCPTILPSLALDQLYLPLRYGGGGYRKSAHLKNAAYLGGFAMAAYGRFNVSQIFPDLEGDVDFPEDSQLPSLVAVTDIFSVEVLQSEIVAVTVTAAAAGVAKPDPASPDDLDPDTFEEQLSAQTAQHETRFKSQIVNGKEPRDEDGTVQSCVDAIRSRATEAAALHRAGWDQKRQRQYDSPDRHPSIMKQWREQGQIKVQRFLSRASDMTRFSTFVTNLSEPLRVARFRGVLNSFNSMPLRVLPNQPEREFSNSEFEWHLSNRLQTQQPSAENISLQNCNCGTTQRPGPVVGDGRHFRKWIKSNVIMRIHDLMRDEIVKMCKAAGLTAVREPAGLLRDNSQERPADIFIWDWKVEGVRESKFAIDFTCPLIDSNWGNLSQAVRSKRASTVGVLGREKEQAKRDKVGTPAEQAERRNGKTIQERCRLEHIHFLPVAIEGDGCTSSGFTAFLNNISNAAGENTEQDRIAFKKYWTTRLACVFSKACAKYSLRRSSSCRQFLAYRGNSAGIIRADMSGEPQTLQPIVVSDRRTYRNLYSARGRSNAARTQRRPF